MGFPPFSFDLLSTNQYASYPGMSFNSALKRMRISRLTDSHVFRLPGVYFASSPPRYRLTCASPKYTAHIHSLFRFVRFAAYIARLFPSFLFFIFLIIACSPIPVSFFLFGESLRKMGYEIKMVNLRSRKGYRGPQHAGTRGNNNGSRNFPGRTERAGEKKRDHRLPQLVWREGITTRGEKKRKKTSALKLASKNS